MSTSSRRAERAKLATLGRVTPYRGDGAGSALLGGGATRGAATRRGPRAALLTLAVLLVVAAGYGILHNRLAASGKTDPALNGVRTTIAPFAGGTSRTTRTARTVWEYVFPGKHDVDEIARLSAENARLKIENETMHNDSEEVARLRQALGFAQKQKKPLLAAEIISLFPTANSATISVARGTRDGVRVGSVARTANGLIGQVTEVGSNTAQVMLLSDALSGVGVLVQRKDPKTGKFFTQAPATVHGHGHHEPLTVVDLPREADVLPGDLVVSSGYGGIFPAGIPVGMVTQIITEKQGFVKSARVSPFAPLPGTLREVFLIR